MRRDHASRIRGRTGCPAGDAHSLDDVTVPCKRGFQTRVHCSNQQDTRPPLQRSSLRYCLSQE